MVVLSRSELFVFKLSWLGLRLIAGIGGLMNEGDEGSIDDNVDELEDDDGGCIDSPFMFRGLRGDGDVIGLPRTPSSGALVVVVVAGLTGAARVDWRLPKVVDG